MLARVFSTFRSLLFFFFYCVALPQDIAGVPRAGYRSLFCFLVAVFRIALEARALLACSADSSLCAVCAGRQRYSRRRKTVLGTATLLLIATTYGRHATAELSLDAGVYWPILVYAWNTCILLIVGSWRRETKTRRRPKPVLPLLFLLLSVALDRAFSVVVSSNLSCQAFFYSARINRPLV